ncbi:hypothetical protein B9Z55_024838 [Caenorhabditis nigoni]|uniref:RING-type domain-containing protein n=1 Tax=Caenorhabditis nigoni TaxID=1611254 RepID=A0A2G5SWH0_9PELO|nr:hypothetical protein B9Z55_024838 [Caenorhabditis nigoni]
MSTTQQSTVNQQPREEPREDEEISSESEDAEVQDDEEDEDYCTACLEYLIERKTPPSCRHGYCIQCFYLLISRRTNCLICNVPIYEIERVFKDLRSRVNIEANKKQPRPT